MGEEIQEQSPAAAASPPRKCRKGQPREGLLGRTRGGGEKPRRALPPPRRERARTREQSAARAVAMGEGESSKSPRATGTEGRREGEGRQAGEGVRVNQGRRARVRAAAWTVLRALWPRAGGRRPSPTRLARSLTLSPAAAASASARRLRGGEVLPLLKLPSPSAPGAAASPRRSARLSRHRRLLASSGAAAGSDCATRTPPGPRCTSARPAKRVSTHPRASQGPPGTVVRPAALCASAEVTSGTVVS